MRWDGCEVEKIRETYHHNPPEEHEEGEPYRRTEAFEEDIRRHLQVASSRQARPVRAKTALRMALTSKMAYEKKNIVRAIKYCLSEMCKSCSI